MPVITVTNMVKLYKYPVIGGIAKKINVLLGVDIPRTVKIGKNVKFTHNSVGTVIHDNTVLEDDVKIYQNVTFGRADIYKKQKNSEFEGFLVKKVPAFVQVLRLFAKKAR